MILVTVGTQLPFDRLIRAVDEWAASSGAEVIGQIGPSSYAPTNMEYRSFFPVDQLQELMNRAQLIISHAGMGSILTAMTLGRPILVVPRRSDLFEHRNDHQMATAKYFQERPFVEVVYDEHLISQSIQKLLNAKFASKLLPYAPDETVAALKYIINS